MMRYETSRMNKNMKKTIPSMEVRAREQLTIKAGLKNKGLLQKELAKTLDLKPDHVGQWFLKTAPKPIPDHLFVQIAAELGFDPGSTRPWLREMYEMMSKIYGSNESISPSDILKAALDLLPPEDRTKLFQDAATKKQ